MYDYILDRAVVCYAKMTGALENAAFLFQRAADSYSLSTADIPNSFIKMVTNESQVTLDDLEGSNAVKS